MLQHSTFKLFIFILFFPGYLFGWQSPVADKPMAPYLEKFNNAPPLKNANWGFCLLEPETGKVLSSFQREKIVTPASTLKLLTTAAALELLGKDFHFETHLEYDGTLDSCGVLHGNLYVKGGGDPTLGSELFKGKSNVDLILNNFAEAVHNAGIKSIKGSVIADDTFFPDCLLPSTWQSTDVGNYYAAGPSGLNFAENSYQLIFQPGKAVGEKTTLIGTFPESIPGLTLQNQVSTWHSGSGDRARVNINPDRSERSILGTIPMGVDSFIIRGSVPDPSLLAANLLDAKLKSSGIMTEKGPDKFRLTSSVKENPCRLRFYTMYSPTLFEIIQQVNLKSHNLFAENLLVMIGKIFRDQGNYESGISVVQGFLESKGINISGMQVYDGSGLSPENKLSSHQLASMLSTIQQDHLFPDFIQTLPVAGVSGTLLNFCKNNKAKGKIYAKSGSMSKIKCYAGYALNKKGEWMPFALLINNYAGSSSTLNVHVQELMEAIVELN